jgi:hypothetical protein
VAAPGAGGDVAGAASKPGSPSLLAVEHPAGAPRCPSLLEGDHPEGTPGSAVAALISHVVVQQAMFNRVLAYNLPTMQRFADRAQILRDGAGIHRPCLLYGPGAIQLSYLTGCAAHYTTAAPRTGDRVISEALANGNRVVVLLGNANTALPTPYSGWERVEVRSKQVRLYARISPRGP